MTEKKLPTPQNPLAELWQELMLLDKCDLCERSGALPLRGGWQLKAIGFDLYIDLQKKVITQLTSKEPVTFLLQLIILQYMLKAQDLPLVDKLVNPHEFVGGDFFFRGPHGFNLKPLEDVFGQDKEGFLAAGKLMGGQPLALADAGLCLPALPRIPITYLLWCADEEFTAKINVLFDATAERQLPLDMLWTLVNQTNKQLLSYSTR